MNVLIFIHCNKVPQMEWLKRNLLSHTSGSLEVQDQLTGGVMLPPSEGAGRESVPTLSPCFWWFPGIFGTPVCSFLFKRYSPYVCIFIQIPFYMGISLLGFGVTLLQYDLILTELITSTTIEFPNKFTF